MANRLLVSEAEARERLKTLNAEAIRTLEESSRLSLARARRLDGVDGATVIAVSQTAS